MAKYVGLLRGINVSGQKKIKMEELRNSLALLAYKNIQTYIQSGNIVFETESTDIRRTEVEIHQNILDTFGFEVPVLVKGVNELKFAFENNPYLNDRNEDTTKLYVAFLKEEPVEENIEKLMLLDTTPDEFVKIGQQIYFFCPNGAGRAKIDNNIIERKLKISATSRNWRTITKLLEMIEG